MARWLITSRWTRRLAASLAAGVAAALLVVVAALRRRLRLREQPARTPVLAGEHQQAGRNDPAGETR